MKKYFLIILGLVLVCNPNIQAQGVTKVGTTAASFLGIDVGPRANAMGSASVSVANDASAMYWNPAGIAKLNNVDAMFSNARWIADLSFNYAGIVLPLGDFGNVGVNATFLSMGEMERTTVAQPEGTGELFDAASYAFGLTYARNLTDQFSIGINAKYINERLYNSNAGGFAIDVGALFDTRFHGIMLGMSISNYGSKMQLDGRDLQIQHDIDPGENGNNANINARLQTDNFDLPLMFRVGVSMDVLKGALNSNLIVSADALHPSDDVESLNVGAEYTFNDMISLRAGYKGLAAKDTEQGLNYGAGLHYVIAGTIMNFDYAYIDFGALNAVHMFSIRLGF
ncbi:MAG: PorV/PorQ family protein [Bacteroidota bacterium]